MKKLLIVFLLSAIAFSQTKGENINMDNPFFKEYTTPFKTPPFNEVKLEHYMPAFMEGIKLQKSEVDAIINNKETSTFVNTIEALEKSGKLLDKVSNVFFNLTQSNTNDDLQKLSKELSPILTKHNDDINLNLKLFERIKVIYKNRKMEKLSPEQNRVLDDYYSDFVRSGANLSDKDKEKLRKINEELSLATLKFGENVLKETNSFEMVLTKKEELDGLPADVISAAAETAEKKGKKGSWVFTLQKPSWIPFLQYSTRRDLREKLYKGYINRGDNNNSNDNKELTLKIVNLRIERAHILGYKSHADFVLEKNMAKNPQKVMQFIKKLWTPALNAAKKESKEIQDMINAEGGKFKVESWDWWYYSEKIKKAKYDFDEEMLRPYFKLENVISGVFNVAGKLFGIKFEERKDIPVYHPDVKVYEVKEGNGKHVGILFVDYFPRDSKRAGAWMNSFRKQSAIGGIFETPVICNVGNFTKPTAEKPALLTPDDVNTLFHEFGHALHGLLSNSVYPSVSGTAVPRDFVELPSQIMENWAFDPEVLKLYATHYQTGEVIPENLVKKLDNSKFFNIGFTETEYLAAALLDMEWHSLTAPLKTDVNEFENKALKKIGLIPEIISRYRSTYFQHIFSGGYSSGYYSYKWAEVLDADAFAAFQESGDVFNKKLADKFRTWILSKGGSEDPMVLYKKFRGAEPKVEPLLKRKGFIK